MGDTSDQKNGNPKVRVPILLALLLLVASCSSPKNAANQPARDLTVFAAASLKETFTHLKKDFEPQHPGVHVVLDFAGSQALALQISKGAPCDVFASADLVQMKMAQVGGRIDPTDVLQFASNRLVVVASPKSKVKSFEDLAKPGQKVVIADAKVPAGAYTRMMLSNIDTKLADGVLKNVVSLEQDVRSVLTKVELGEADAGIVYKTDALVAKDVRTIEIPKKEGVDSNYYVAALGGANYDLAKNFVALVMSPDGQNTLAAAGFIVHTN